MASCNLFFVCLPRAPLLESLSRTTRRRARLEDSKPRQLALFEHDRTVLAPEPRKKPWACLLRHVAFLLLVAATWRARLTRRQHNLLGATRAQAFPFPAFTRYVGSVRDESTAMRTFDRTMGHVVVIIGLGMPVIVGVVLAVAGLMSRRPQERMFGVGAGVLIALVGSLLGVGVFALSASTAKPPQLVATLRELQARLGGALVLASIFSPIMQPRLITRIDGREVEIRAFRRKQSLVGLALGIPRWFLLVTAEARPQGEVFLIGPMWARETRAGLFGREPVATPWPLAGGVAAFSKDARGAHALLADPELFDRMGRLAQLPEVQSIGVAPTLLGGLGVTLTGGLTQGHDAARLEWLAREVVGVAARVR